jgi:uncharacterized protein YqjF (DUF2071 family)
MAISIGRIGNIVSLVVPNAITTVGARSDRVTRLGTVWHGAYKQISRPLPKLTGVIDQRLRSDDLKTDAAAWSVEHDLRPTQLRATHALNLGRRGVRQHSLRRAPTGGV